MDNLLINLIGVGKQGGTTGNASLKESSGVGSSQKGFLNILTNILSEGDGQISLLSKLKEMQESGESGLACVMSSISNILLSIVPPEAVNASPEVPRHVISEISEDKTEQEKLAKTGIEKKTTGLNSWLEQNNYSALQEILTDTKSQKIDAASTDKIPTVVVLRNGTEIEAEQVKAFQEELIKLLSYLNGKSELLINNNKTSFQDKLEMMPVQNTAVNNFQQTTLEENRNNEIEVIQALNKQPTSELSKKEVLEKNAAFLHATLKNEGKVNGDENNKIDKTLENKGIDGLFKTDEKIGQNIVKQSFDAGQGFDERGGDKAKGETNTMVLNATKKYKEHISETNKLTTTLDSELKNVSAQESTNEVPQGESFKTNILQVKDNNITFEKGSFTSFVTDRIEKIVEQFSNRVSQMDMVVRLKLDDKETLLVGLKHEGQKIIVDVKASSDGLINLIQTHKNDIARHLEDKNIFTSIFVQPDGERNYERRSQEQNKREEKKKEAGTSFKNILETTA
jgi:hypothetical protein